MRFQRVLSIFAASFFLFAPVQALSQQPEESVSVRDRPRPEYDPLGVRLGGFTLNGALDLGVASTDNLFALQDALAVDDMIYTVGPHAKLSSNWSRHALSLEGGAESSIHGDFDNQDATTYYVRGVGRLDIGVDSSLVGAAGFAHLVEPRTDPDAPVTIDPVEYDHSDVSLTAQHTFNRLRVVGEIAHGTYDFDGTQSFRDNDETVFRGRVEAELTPRIAAVFEATTDERNYDNSPADDSDGQTYLLGATINFTDLLVGEITAGQFQRDYSGLGSTDGLALAGNLEWYITRLTTLSFDAHRNAEDVVGGATGLPYVETAYGARLDHELLRNLILTAGVRGGQREYDVIDRNDDFWYGDLGADWFLNRRVALRARYQHDQVDSSGVAAYRDYDVNTLSLGLSLRL